MKSILLLLAAAAAAAAPLRLLAQAASPSPAGAAAAALFNPAPAASPAPSAIGVPSPASSSSGAAHDAAVAVPLPGQPSGQTLEKNMPLIPEEAPPSRRSHSGKARPGASPQEYATFQTEHDIGTRVRMRMAETRALNDPVVQADWVAAHAALTDTRRRALLTTYYTHLYDKMARIDPSLAERIATRKLATLARMKYTRLGDDDDNSENPFAPVPQAASGPNPPSSDTVQ